MAPGHGVAPSRRKMGSHCEAGKPKWATGPESSRPLKLAITPPVSNAVTTWLRDLGNRPVIHQQGFPEGAGIRDKLSRTFLISNHILSGSGCFWFSRDVASLDRDLNS